MSKLPVWDFFIDAVEGRPGAFPVVIKDGYPAVPFSKTSEQAPPPRARPNAGLLADLLEAGEPIPARIREWLADMMDDEGSGPLRIRSEGRGAPKLHDLTASLRSAVPLPHFWKKLGRLFREESPGAPRLSLGYRPLGAPNRAAMANWDAARFYEQLMKGRSRLVDGKWVIAHVEHALTEESGFKRVLREGHMTRPYALALTMQYYGISKTSVTNALASLSAARERAKLDNLIEFGDMAEESRD